MARACSATCVRCSSWRISASQASASPPDSLANTSISADTRSAFSKISSRASSTTPTCLSSNSRICSCTSRSSSSSFQPACSDLRMSLRSFATSSLLSAKARSRSPISDPATPRAASASKTLAQIACSSFSASFKRSTSAASSRADWFNSSVAIRSSARALSTSPASAWLAASASSSSLVNRATNCSASSHSPSTCRKTFSAFLAALCSARASSSRCS
mmetsp:Transcript_64426/g.172498  ORF Transcript_64426/g.172498 Transcript_64426/m.172498 type:complete len:218 (+) Transcript_64426:551-1204(+)